ncbi:MAG: helix-turn-helix transcriptional regulator [Flavobacteriales bacterium]|nr:helix-turn-helix transcriptional regulator [Flavobacteriales bacterium]
MEPQLSSPSANKAPRVDLLTEVELFFIKLCCDEKGFSYKLIADHMGISVNTVHSHRRKVFAKLKVPTRIALVLLALRLGLG